MAAGSTIEWTDATWNPISGCTPVSAGCKHCYAARMALRLSHIPNATGQKYGGIATRTRDGLPVFNGRINLDRDSLLLPRTWRLPRMIFVNSMSDLFHEAVPLFYVKEVFDVMRTSPQHTFQVLTKRPERAALLSPELPWPKNVWMGTSVEDERVLSRVDELRKIPSAVRFLSCEPLIGPLTKLCLDNINWVIVGGESGPSARPMNERWVLHIKRLCRQRRVPFFFKQWGGVNKKATGRVIQGREWNECPKPLTQSFEVPDGEERRQEAF